MVSLESAISITLRTATIILASNKMKAQIFVLTQESFLTSIGIKLENGLMLKTHHTNGGNLAWAGKEVRVNTIKQFEEFVDSLANSGFEISGRELIEEYK